MNVPVTPIAAISLGVFSSNMACLDPGLKRYENTNLAQDPVFSYRTAYAGRMVRLPLTAQQLAAGKRIGEQIRQARGERTLGEVAEAAAISPETLRKIETGRLATPAFTTIAALARVLPLSLDELADICLDRVSLPHTG